MKMTAMLLTLSLTLGLGTVPAEGQQPVNSPSSRQLCKQMGLALGKSIVDGSVEEGTKCDQLLDTLLTRTDLTSDILQAVAQVARMRNQPQKAISAVECAMAKYPDTTFPSIELPGRIVGHFWIASIARQSGDLRRANAAYESLMQDPFTRGEGEENKSFRMGVCLLQADCFASSGDIAKARETLGAIPAVQNPNKSPHDWAAFYLANLEKGTDQVRQTRRQTDVLRSCAPMTWTFVQLNGVGDFPVLLTFGDQDHYREVLLYGLKQSADSKQSGIETEAARYCLGTVYMEKDTDLAKAKGYFDTLSKSDSFFAPEAGLRLLECTKKEQKAKNVAVDTAQLVQELKTRFPGYAPAIDEVDKAPVPER